MAKSYKALKNKKYFETTKGFVESLLDVEFLDSRRAHCPFHDDRTDSFRMYVDGKDEIRFHCFGECEGDWDVYDLIMMKRNCSFKEAQVDFAKYLGIDDINLHSGINKEIHMQGEQEEESDEPVIEVDTEDLTADHRRTLEEAAEFYNNLLLSRKDKFEKILKYLQKRGVDEEIIKKFSIGFSPALEDKEFIGRALLTTHAKEFMTDLNKYQLFRRTGLLRLLNDESAAGYKYYRRHIDTSPDNPFGFYSDYFVNRIIFPVYDIGGQIEGMIGRRLDNRRVRWLKQVQEYPSRIRAKGWLYGIDKSARGIEEYQTAIVVEGIFDFFAFYNISENTDRPIVVSTLGSKIDKSAFQQVLGLGAKNLIIAFDWDAAGMRAIRNAVEEFKEVNISFLGSLKEDEDPADKLKGISSKISNFGIRHLQEGMKVKSRSGKPVMASFIVQRQQKDKQIQDEILLKPAETIIGKPTENDPKDFWYKINDILVLLSYDHRNRAELDQKLKQIKSLLEDPQKHQPAEEEQDQYFQLPRKFIKDEYYIKIGDSLILHLRLAIEQQTRKRKIKETDETLAEWLKTSRKTIFKYKAQLKRANLLNIEKTGRTQKLSVKYFSTPARKINMRKVD